MKLHRNLVFAVVDALNMIFNQDQYADKVVEKVLKFDKRWGSRDRGFIAETTYEMVRYKRLYETIAEVKAPYSRENLYRMWAVWAVLKGHQLPDWKQVQGTPERKIKGRFDEFSSIRKMAESIPDWMDELGVKALGEKFWTKEIHALNQEAKVVLRANTLNCTREQLYKELLKLDIVSDKLDQYPDALVLKRRSNVFKTDLFKNGWFEVQDASSQLVAPFLEVEAGMRVIDACAGAGGKSLHLAAQMENKGQLIALDIYGNKLKELKRRAKRDGAHNIETRLIDSTKVIKKLKGQADRLLIDAPCTGLGVLRRNPDAKWKLDQAFLDRVTKTQEELLQSYSSMVKKGGKMVYATCSILPQENQMQVEAFLKSEVGQSFQFEKEQHVFASKSGFDGFYMALLKKID